MIGLFLRSPISGYILLALVASLIAGYFWVKHTGYLKCQNEIIIKQVTIAEKRNEIANNRPDDVDFFNGLLSDDNW